MGVFKAKDRACRNCESAWTDHEEKETDVNIALHLLRDAHQDRFDRALLISGDSDLVPAVRMVRALFPQSVSHIQSALTQPAVTSVTPSDDRASLGSRLAATRERGRARFSREHARRRPMDLLRFREMGASRHRMLASSGGRTGLVGPPSGAPVAAHLRQRRGCLSGRERPEGFPRGGSHCRAPKGRSVTKRPRDLLRYREMGASRHRMLASSGGRTGLVGPPSGAPVAAHLRQRSGCLSARGRVATEGSLKARDASSSAPLPWR